MWWSRWPFARSAAGQRITFPYIPPSSPCYFLSHHHADFSKTCRTRGERGKSINSCPAGWRQKSADSDDVHLHKKDRSIGCVTALWEKRGGGRWRGKRTHRKKSFHRSPAAADVQQHFLPALKCPVAAVAQRLRPALFRDHQSRKSGIAAPAVPPFTTH